MRPASPPRWNCSMPLRRKLRPGWASPKHGIRPSWPKRSASVPRGAASRPLPASTSGSHDMRVMRNGASCGAGIASASLLLLALLGACGGQSPESERSPGALAANSQQAPGRVIEVRDTSIPAILEVAGTAEPVLRATLSTRLTGTVTAVLVQEGARVTKGQLLARMDARDLAARRLQVEAGMAEAEAVHRDAVTQAMRFRSLYADSAATRAQLDAAETGLARAEASVRSAQAAARELDATAAYAGIRAPFAGVVTQRFVDPGAFVAPGSPLATVQDVSRL